ncbi:MAG: SDR family oxidoreductase [Microbispora sp.]|nr:SDR family oxidoreductase [Microbispora sp.]
MPDHGGKVFIVTGAASGIGRAAALRLAADRARVALADIDGEGGEATAEAIRAAGGEARFQRVDVRTGPEVERFFEAVDREWGRLDGAFCNAGINGPTARIEEYAEADFDRVLATNLKAVWLTMRSALPRIRRAGGGAIVNTGSTASLLGYGTLGGYVAAKHGVLGLTKTAALEYAADGVRVNCVCPGPIDTPLMQGIEQSTNPDNPMAVREAFAQTTALKRYGRPEEIGALVSFLLSDEAAYITGAAVSIDGGVVAGI